MKGQTVCRMHGGASKASREAGLRRVAISKALADSEAQIAHKAEEGVDNPLDILAKLASEALAMKDALASRVNAMEKLIGYDYNGSEQLRAEVVLYERALDRSARFVDLLAKSGFEEARVRLEQQKGQLVAYVMKRILDRLELSDSQKVLVGTVVPDELRRLNTEGN